MNLFINRFLSVLCLLAILTNSVSVIADEKLPTEDDYYRISTFNLPDGEVLEAAGFQLLPNGKMAVCTRRGEIWLIENPFAEDASKSKLTLFAQGLHEPLSLAWREGWLYAVQRAEVTRMKDSNGDGQADLFECFNDDWGISGDYHEYAFGSKFDKNGDLWITLCLTGSFSSKVKYRGWCVRITPEGKLIPSTSGIRSPGGMGANSQGDIFYTDNQGPWNGTCSLKHLIAGKFAGHPGGFAWYDTPEAKAAMGPKPEEPLSNSRFMIEADKLSHYEPPSVLFPYTKMGKSASGIACDTSKGKFGLFQDQLFVGDQTQSSLMRVYMEKVNGHYQGACFPFRSGFGSGTLGVEMTAQGAMFVSGTNRGWGSIGTKPFAIERLNWTGKNPFEVLQMNAKPDGFELVFTEPVDRASVENLASYQIETYTYIYQSSYGSPEVDHTTPTIKSAKVSADGKRVHLIIDGLQRGHIHELHAPGIRSAKNLPLLHDVAYYTLNHIPK
ncbi:MAG: hypothetical protein JKY95_18890 [Planctomycetaceae bacterium]|nr:hypothetical protein [Planctomycetaceae bacterium]